MSDLHAGAETSLISNVQSQGEGKFKIDRKTASPVTVTLSAAMRATLSTLNKSGHEPPDLVLLGDVLDLSLSPPDRAAEVFETFARSFLMGEDRDTPSTHLSRRVYFIPGNHDHSLWTALRYQTETYSKGDDKYGVSLSEKGVLTRFAPVTPAFDKPHEHQHSTLIQEILGTATGQDYTVPVYYPNMGDRNSEDSRAVVFHHGHFVEATYKMLSLMVAGFHGRECGPLTATQLERENGNWIDFGWSTVGENGPIGEHVASVYQFLLTGSEESRLQDRLARTLSENLTKALPLPKTNQVRDVVKIMAKGIIDATVGKFSQTERLRFTSHLSPDSIQGLRDYLIGAVGPQMLDHFKESQPAQTAFIFGHTHKPLEDQIVVDGMVSSEKDIEDKDYVAPMRMFASPVEVYNTGGWILDTSLLSTKEGASIIFVDDDMNVAALRAYNSTTEDKPIPAYVHSLDPGNPMELALKEAVKTHKDLWNVFNQKVADEMRLRQEGILAATASADMRSTPEKGEVDA